MLEGN